MLTNTDHSSYQETLLFKIYDATNFTNFNNSQGNILLANNLAKTLFCVGAETSAGSQEGKKLLSSCQDILTDPGFSIPPIRTLYHLCFKKLLGLQFVSEFSS